MPPAPMMPTRISWLMLFNSLFGGSNHILADLTVGLVRSLVCVAMRVELGHNQGTAEITRCKIYGNRCTGQTQCIGRLYRHLAVLSTHLYAPPARSNKRAWPSLWTGVGGRVRTRISRSWTRCVARTGRGNWHPEPRSEPVHPTSCSASRATTSAPDHAAILHGDIAGATSPNLHGRLSGLGHCR